MKVQCEQCQTSLNLPDDKLSPGHDFSFNCPKCKVKNTVHVPVDLGGPPEEQAHDLDSEDAALGEFFEEGAKPALVCFDPGPLRDKVVEAAKNVGYVPVCAASTRDALKRIRMTQYRMILIQETYEGQTKDDNAVLRLIQPMETPLRRRIFVALFGKDLQTFDHMTAYALSVNSVISLADEGKFDKILHRALSEYDRFYKVYFDVMREMGKI